MTPHIKIQLKTSAYKSFWLKYVWGFDPLKTGYDCLIGEPSNLILRSAGKPAYPAGMVFEGHVDQYQAPYLFLCGVSRNGARDCVHLAFEIEDLEPNRLGVIPSPRQYEGYEDANIIVEAIGLVPIALDKPEGIDSLPELVQSSKCWQFGWTQFPSARCPLKEIGERPFEEEVANGLPKEEVIVTPVPDVVQEVIDENKSDQVII